MHQTDLMKKLITLITLLFIGSVAFSQITITSTVTNVTCFGLSNGSATISAAGGAGGYTYTWTPTNTNSNIITGITAGQYTVTVTDASLATGSLVVTIGEPSLLGSITNANNVRCYGTATGTISVAGTGGTSPYSYIWTAPGSTLSTVPNVPVGNYGVTITDANGCVTTNSVSVMQPTQITAATTQTNATCNGACNGVAQVNASGGTAPYTFYWNSSPIQVTQIANNLCPSNYTISVTDANNCLFQLITTITQPTQIMATTTVTNANCGQSNGTICANITGGTGGYYIYWSSGSNTNCTANVPAGAYTFTVVDMNGCLTVQSGLVNNIGGPIISVVSQTNVSCFGGNNGAVTTTVTGGTAPYNYSWSGNGGTQPSASGMTAGINNLTVIDNTGCVGTASVMINQPNPINIATNSTNALCGQNNGSISSTVTGGTPVYMYSWIPNVGFSNTVQNLSAGSYTLQITDVNGCISATSASVSSIGNGALSSVTASLIPTQETCLNLYDGSLNLTLAGSNTGPFTYQWNNGATTQDIFNLNANYYSVIVFDTNMNCLSIGDTVTFDGTICGSISGNVFIDNNSDCVKNSGDGILSNVQIITNPGNRIGYTNYNGDYYFYNLPFGTYTLTSNTNSNMIATCSTTLNSIVNSGAPNSTNNNFAKEYIPITQPDLHVSAYSNGIVPGFVCRAYYALHNYNSFNANGVFKATLPSSFIPNITNASPTTYSLSGDTIIWNFTNIAYLSGSVGLYVEFTVPLSTALGGIFTSCMWAQPSITDFNYVNNTFCYSRQVTGSFDPNDKTVSPVGVGANGDISATETDLTYLIRFQNTGNGPAVNIVVKDTLSPNVDVNTFEMLGSSHNYNIEILPGNILKWKFNNIMLPDSNSNEPGSHGYIQYRIKRNSNNTPGTQIKNTAYIYFDFNEPVVTNTAINTIETVTGISTQSNSNDGWNVYPNPSTGALYIVNSSSVKEASQVQVLNAIGQTILEETITSNYKNLDLSKLTNGVYFVKITSDKNSTVKRIVLSK